jgi:hypothetical protein
MLYSMQKGDSYMKKLVAMRLDDEQLQKLEQLVQVTGWTQSEVLRKLIDNAWVTPPAIGTELPTKKADALALAA